MKVLTEAQRQKRLECQRAWRARNPEKMKWYNRYKYRYRYKAADRGKIKAWREKRMAVPGYRENINDKRNRHIQEVRKFVNEQKAAVGCIDCGFKDSRALDFDHIDPSTKSFNLCTARTIEGAIKEMAKCEVRCANCHRIKTHERRQQKRQGTGV